MLGDAWSVLIIRDAFLGVRSFEDFQRRLRIPRQTLSIRLKRLEGDFVLFRKPYRERPLRYEYRLTEKGLDLYPFVVMAWRWQRKWGSRLDPLPDELVHDVCGRVMQPRYVCGHCRLDMRVEDVAYADGPGAGREDGPKRTRVALRDAYLVADRWTHLVLAAVFLGHDSFEAIQRHVLLASNVLAHRLKLLVDTGLLVKSSAAADARRYVYALTEKSRDVFPMTIALAHWADRWLGRSQGPPRLRRHVPCGRALAPLLACGGCGAELRPWQVSFREGAKERPARPGTRRSGTASSLRARA